MYAMTLQIRNRLAEFELQEVIDAPMFLEGSLKEAVLPRKANAQKLAVTNTLVSHALLASALSNVTVYCFLGRQGNVG